MGNSRGFLKLINDFCKNIAKFILDDERLCSSKFENKAMVPTFTTLIELCTGSSSKCNKARKKLSNINWKTRDKNYS